LLTSPSEEHQFNQDCYYAEFPTAKTEEELHTCVEEDGSSNLDLFLSVDDRTVSDGYWVILEPLSPGEHDIHFKASLTNPTTGVLF
jgi:hypothetical protein